jgi:hypothetical protein
LWLCSDWARLLVLAGDHSYAQPVRMQPGASAERGRGLVVVEALSTGWGWYPATSRGLAKVVWAEIQADSPASRHPGEISWLA